MPLRLFNRADQPQMIRVFLALDEEILLDSNLKHDNFEVYWLKHILLQIGFIEKILSAVFFHAPPTLD